MDEYGRSMDECDDVSDRNNVGEGATPKVDTFESRRGHDLWRSVHRVVRLVVNVRSPGQLSQLLAEMRAGCISDELWKPL